MTRTKIWVTEHGTRRYAGRELSGKTEDRRCPMLTRLCKTQVRSLVANRKLSNLKLVRLGFTFNRYSFLAVGYWRKLRQCLISVRLD